MTITPNTSIRLTDDAGTVLCWVESVDGDRVVLRLVTETKITLPPGVPWLDASKEGAKP